MKKCINYFVAIFVLIMVTSNSLVAQDKLFKKNQKEAILIKVVEIGTGEIKYKLWDEKETGPIYVSEKTSITRIEFENGKTEIYGRDAMDLEIYFEGQSKRALKIGFLGPLFGHTSLTYEHSLKPGRSIETKAVIVGLGFNELAENNKGFIGSAAYKFYRKPSFVTASMKRRHILQGIYFKPEVFLGKINRTKSGTFDGVRDWNGTHTEVGGGLLLNFGNQWVIGESLLIDFSTGFGYGGGELSRVYLVGEGFAITANLNIGYAF